MIQDIWLIKANMRAGCPFLTWRRETRTHTSSRGQPLLDAHCLIMFNLEAQVPNRNYPHVNFIFIFQGNAYKTVNKLRVSVSSSCYQVKNSSLSLTIVNSVLIH